MTHSNMKKTVILCLLAFAPVGCVHSRGSHSLNLGHGGGIEMVAVLLVALPVMGIIALVKAASSSEDEWQEDTESSTAPKSMRELEKKWAKRGTWK